MMSRHAALSVQAITVTDSVAPAPKQQSSSYNQQLVWLKSRVCQDRLISEMIQFPDLKPCLSNRRPTLELERGL